MTGDRVVVRIATVRKPFQQASRARRILEGHDATLEIAKQAGAARVPEPVTPAPALGVLLEWRTT